MKEKVLIELSQMPNLSTLHLGHYEHGDYSCDQHTENEGAITAIFKEPKAFPKLQLLFLEQNCSLTYQLDTKLKEIKIRK